MITKINEFKTYLSTLKSVNEGGGSGIIFKTENVNLTVQYILEKTKDGYKHTLVSSNVDCDTFDATGYDDGGNNFNCDTIIDWSVPALTLDDLMSIVISDSSDFVGITEGNLTIGQIFSQLGEDMKTITIDISATYNYNNIKFPGYMRGIISTGDVIFAQENNRYGLDYNYYEIYIKYNNDIYDTNADNDVIITKISPIGKASENFTSFYNDVFNYDLTSDAKINLYYTIINTDTYDDEVEDYIDINDLNLTIDEFKKSLENEEEYIQDDEFWNWIETNHNNWIQNISDNHFTDVATNYIA